MKYRGRLWKRILLYDRFPDDYWLLIAGSSTMREARESLVSVITRAETNQAHSGILSPYCRKKQVFQRFYWSAVSGRSLVPEWWACIMRCVDQPHPSHWQPGALLQPVDESLRPHRNLHRSWREVSGVYDPRRRSWGIGWISPPRGPLARGS
jgi:hypothetical protein